MILFTHHPRLTLALILIAYLISATLFALLTPAWQMPDEPAHYNYIAHIARGDGLPVLAMGDFDMDYIGQIVGARFPPEMSVEVMRYEFYQPPLYYISAVPVYWLAGGTADAAHPESYGHALIALRLYGVGLGVITLLLLYSCAATAFPDQPLIRLGATAFAATLPMHVAMTAALNNDSLAILLLLASSLVLLKWIASHAKTNGSDGSDFDENQREREFFFGFLYKPNRMTALLGILLGLGLLTKIYAYVFLPVCVIVVFLAAWRNADIRSGLLQSSWVIIPAILLGLPLWLRNMSLYGLLDPLGLAWHDLVVAGQPTTAEWVAQYGWAAYWERAFGFTFRSFWGVFGWLGLFWDSRLYAAVRILTITIGLGLLQMLFRWVWLRFRGSQKEERDGDPYSFGNSFRLWSTLFFGITLIAILLSYSLYNLKFVQHQGRYFFWGMLPISLLFALGWRQLMGRTEAFLAALALLILGAYSIIAGDQNLWTLLSYLVMATLLLLQGLLCWILKSSYTISTGGDGFNGQISAQINEQANGQKGWERLSPQPLRALFMHPVVIRTATLMCPLIWAFPFIGLNILGIYSLFGYIIPQL
ncbi:MAG: hypothetical protein AAF702_03110 [Chloroflexota bacterium]